MKALRPFRLQAFEGFTLFEVLIALALLSISFVVIFQLFSSGLKGIGASDEYVAALLRAESKMREVIDDETLSEKSLSEITDDGYRIDTSVEATAQERTETLPVVLLEINVTVHWTSGSRERVITLKTQKMTKKKV